MRQKRIRLTEKQKNFAIQYIKNGGNGTKAAMHSYPNITRATAQTIGTKNPNNPKIREYMTQLAEKIGLGQDDILRGLKTIADAGLSKKALAKSTTKETLKAFRLGAELQDMMPSQRKIIDKRTLSLSADIENKTEKELMEQLKGIQKELEFWKKRIEADTLAEQHRKEVGDGKYYDEIRERIDNKNVEVLGEYV